MLAVPLFHDQMRNSRIAERVGIAKRLDKKNLADKQKLIEALRDVIDGRKWEFVTPNTTPIKM